MRLYRILPGLVLSLLVGAPVGQAEAAAILTPGPARPALAFEPNQGQADPAVKFLARGRGFGLFLTQTETVLVVSPAAGAARRPGADGGEATAPSVVRMRLVGADAAPTVTGLAPLPGRVHSLVGDPDRWRRDVPTFARVQYADVYPGISLVFYGREGQLEYDFVVAPNADPDAVVMAFDGAQNLKVDGDGDLVIATGAGDVRMRRPVIYQEIGQERRPIEGGYVLDGDRVRFRVAGHDPSHPLIIDPVLGYSSILNGSSDDQGFGIAVDSVGNVYVTGTTISSNFPVSPVLPVQATRDGESDAFVTKLDATGLIIVYSTFLGGSGADAGTAIAVDGNGSAYIAGTTNSNNFPTTAASFQPGTRGGDEAFVARLGPDGSALVFSTYLGSNGRDSAFGLALDVAGNAYVTGFTTAPTFPNNNAIPCFGTTSTGADVFVVRIDPAGLTLSSCTIIGGAGEDVGNAIAVDPSGNIWVAGTTNSFDLPLPFGLGLQPFLAGAQDAFVAKLSPAGVVLALTYLGGVGDEEGLAIAVDLTGNVYIAGSTKSSDFPTFRALQPFLNGRTNAFVVKLSPAGDSAAFATFLGGSGDDSANAVAVNPSDSTVYLAGSTNSVDFPVVAPIQGQLAGGFDVFVTKLTAAGDAFVYSTYLGGTNDEEARALAVDVNGIAYVAGSTRSVAFPAVRLVGTGGLLDVFVTQITDVPIIQFTSPTFQVDETAGSVTIGVQRIGDTTGTATVQFAASNGTATAGSDFGTQGSTTPPSGILGFGPGQIVATFTIPILNSGPSCKGDRTVNLSLNTPSFGTVLGSRNTSTLTILDTSPCINFTSPTYTVTENKGPAQISVSRSGPTGILATVQFSTSDLTAVAGVDYTAVVNRTVTFLPGAKTVNVPITIINNTILDGNRSVNLSLSGAVGAQLVPSRSSAVLTIVDDELGGTVQFAAALTTVTESVGVAKVLVSRTGSTAGGATVSYTTVNGTAMAGADFGVIGNGTPPSGTLTFLAGQTTQPIFVPIVNTGMADGVRSLTLTPVDSAPQPGHGARGADDHDAQDRRRRSRTGLQRPDLFGEGERRSGDHHGRADRRDLRAGHRHLGHQRHHRDRRQRLRDSGNPGESDAACPLRYADVPSGRIGDRPEDQDVLGPDTPRFDARGHRDGRPDAEWSDRGLARAGARYRPAVDCRR